MFSKLVTALQNGKCEHVSENDATQMTSVKVNHISVAIGKVVYNVGLTGIFRLEPVHIVMIQKNREILSSEWRRQRNCALKFVTSVRTDGVTGMFLIDFVLVRTYELSILFDLKDMYRNIPGNMYKTYAHFSIANGRVAPLQYLLDTYHKSEMEEKGTKFTKLSRMFPLGKKGWLDNFNALAVAVISNKPEMIDVLNHYFHVNDESRAVLRNLAECLGHNQCLVHLETDDHLKEKKKAKIKRTDTSGASVSELADPQTAFRYLLSVLKDRQSYYSFTGGQVCLMIQNLIASGLNPGEPLKDGSTPLHLLCQAGVCSYDGHLCYPLFQHGADVNAVESKNETPLYHAMFTDCSENIYTCDNKIWFIRYLLYHNPNWELIKHWECFKSYEKFRKLSSRKSESTDVRLGDDLDICSDLLECGFKPADHPDLRQLKKMCRDKLRQTYKGTGIHRFVKELGLPPSIQDFILIKKFYKEFCSTE